jgi:hypothetical protein
VFWDTGKENKEEILGRLIIAHYRHAHTDYDVERNNIDKWIAPQKVKKETGFDSFEKFLEWYEYEKDGMDKFKREWWIGELNALRSIAVENAKEHYTNVTRKLAEEDGLIQKAQISDFVYEKGNFT